MVTSLGGSYQCRNDMQTTLCEWFQLFACPCLVTSNILEYSLLKSFHGKSNVNQACDTSLMVALPAELKQTCLHLYEEIKISSSGSFPQPAHKSLAEFLLKLKSYSCIKEEKRLRKTWCTQTWQTPALVSAWRLGQPSQGKFLSGQSYSYIYGSCASATEFVFPFTQHSTPSYSIFTVNPKLSIYFEALRTQLLPPLFG